MSPSKNHTISKIVAKAVFRITIILLALPIIIYFTNSAIMSKQVSFSSPWAIAAPLLLLLTFLVLLVVVLKNRYTKIEYNWLLTLSGLFVCLYLILFYTRVLSIF
ncbi:hypothetical protein [Sphingobacterium suaedae]|uniref:Uncharacterized protein n=1 Tax=Sphingobacterium suaedae TaxID=1686402 RepID=A0ABW5KHV0_9SPHI